MKVKEKNNQHYLKPAIAVFNVLEDKYLLATSPIVRTGGDGTPPGGITVEDPISDNNDNELEG